MTLYDAFISYSHAKDKPIAAALQSAIQKLGKPWYRRRALRLFRDDTSLAATPHLWPMIEQALGQSRHFILLASPEAAASKWVNKEVAFWLERNSINSLLIGLTGGELVWDDSAGDFLGQETVPLPNVLAKRFPSEPKWVDLRPYREGAAHAANKRDAKFTELAADFAAAIHGMPKEDLLSQEVRQQRRALTLAWSAAASLLILAVMATAAGILAYREEQEAVTQRNRAEQALTAATKTANSLVFGLAQRFKNSIGIPATLVKDILDRARALQEELVNSGQVTPDLKRSEGESLIETVDTLLAIGETTGALAAAQQAKKIFTVLLAGSSNSADYQRELSVALGKIGDVQVAQGDLAGALKSYRDGLAIAERLAQSDPGNAQWQYDVGISEERIGDILMAQGDLAGALKAYQAKEQIIGRLTQSDPANAGWQRDRAIAFEKIGDAQRAQGDLAAALGSYSRNSRYSTSSRSPMQEIPTGNACWPCRPRKSATFRWHRAISPLRSAPTGMRS